MMNNSKAACRLAVAAALSFPFASQAQSTATPDQEVVGLGEVIVTAQKREQSLQDVPLSVSAFSGEFLKETRLGDIRGLVSFTPGFSGNTEDSFTDALAIRGISTNDFGIGGDPSVAVFIDGVWAGRTGGVQNAFYDIERAEVVKGPQATLFGRNAIAGAISIITNKPVDHYEASTEVTLADYDHVEGTATLNLPLNDRWYFRGSVYGLDNSGFLKNLQGGRDLGYHDDLSTRMALRYAGDSVDAVLTAMYEDRKQDPSVYWVPAAGLPVDRVNTDLADNGFDESDIFEVRANVEWSLANDYSLTSITGYKSFNFDYLEDYDGGPTVVNNYHQMNAVDYKSQEIRFNSPANGKVVWFAGASMYRENIDGIFDFIYTEDDLCRAVSITEAPDFAGPASGCDDPNFEDYWGSDIDPADLLTNKSERNIVHMESEGWAAYGDFTINLLDNLALTAGARYTYDQKKIRNRVLDSGGALGNNFNFEFFTDGFVSNKGDWNDFTPRLALSFKINDDVNLYANAARGYKSGGFATFGFDLHGLDVTDEGVAPPGTTPVKFNPEQIDSFEIGAKSRLLNNTLQLNTSLYYYKYKDLQMVYFDTGSSLVANVGKARGQGLEADMRWAPNGHWDISLGLSLLDTKITDSTEMEVLGACGDCSGNHLPFAPEVTNFAIVTYKRALGSGEMYFTTEEVYQSEMFGGPDNIPDAAVSSWNRFAFRAGYRSDADWWLSLWIENAFDEKYFERGWENADVNNQFGYGLFNEVVWPSKPRTIGVTAGRRWK